MSLFLLRILAISTTRGGSDGIFQVPEIEGWLEWTRSLRDSFALSFNGIPRDFGRLPGCVVGRKQVIFAHPLWDCARPSELLAEALVVTDRNTAVRFLDTFNVVRRPSFAYQSLA